MLRLHFKRSNNNLKRKWFWVRQIFTERYLKEAFMIWLRNWNYFDHEFFFKHIATWYFDSSQPMFHSVFRSRCIQQFHWLIILLNNFFCFGGNFFSIPNRKKISSKMKRNYCVFSRCACAKLKIFLSME